MYIFAEMSAEILTPGLPFSGLLYPVPAVN